MMFLSVNGNNEEKSAAADLSAAPQKKRAGKRGNLLADLKNRGKSILLPAAILVLMIVFQSVVILINEKSLSQLFPKLWQSWLNILRNNAYTGIIAIGMYFVMLTGGIDLSVGSMTCAIGAVVMYLVDPSIGLLASFGIIGAPAYIFAILAAVLVGFLLGELNGVLITWGRVPPMICTLGTMKIFRSVTQQLTKKFNPTVPSGFKQIASFKIGSQVILPVIYWVVIVAVLHIIFRKTAFGKQTTAIGSNVTAAGYSGINVKRVLRRVYALCGVMCAFAAVIYVARIGSMDFANAGSGYEMDSIAAVGIFGTSASGGGSVLGTFVGMLLIGSINNILNMLGVPTFLCDAVRGALIIIAVLLQYFRKKDR